MDKLDLVLDIIEHPADYSEQELEQLLADHEVRKLYDGLSKLSASESARSHTPGKDKIDRRWEEFADMIPDTPRRPVILRLFGSRAATVAAILATSIVAIAVCVGINTEWLDSDSNGKAAAHEVPEAVEAKADTDEVEGNVQAGATVAETGTVEFENVPLAEILARMAPAYGVEVNIVNSEAGSLRLFFRWDTSQPLNEVVEQLNNFDRIHISVTGGIMTVK